MKKTYWLAGALLLAAAPAFAQQTELRKDPPRTITVNGTGTVQRQPDRAVILISVESRAPSAQQAAQTNATKMDAVFAALRKVGIVPPSVATISYGLQPEYGQPDPKTGNNYPRVIGYVANNMVRVQVDTIARVGSVIDATVASGANRIDNLSFELRDSESARLEALRRAVEKARAEAEVVATAAGQKLGPPLSISSSSGWTPQPMYRRADMGMAMEAQAAPTPIEAGNLTVTGTVSITYQLEDR